MLPVIGNKITSFKVLILFIKHNSVTIKSKLSYKVVTPPWKSILLDVSSIKILRSIWPVNQYECIKADTTMINDFMWIECSLYSHTFFVDDFTTDTEDFTPPLGFVWRFELYFLVNSCTKQKMSFTTHILKGFDRISTKVTWNILVHKYQISLSYISLIINSRVLCFNPLSDTFAHCENIWEFRMGCSECSNWTHFQLK